MEVNPIDRDKIQDLRTWFHPKDRSVYLAANCLAYLSNGAYLSNAFIAETVLAASAASVTFSNIPQGFRHLLIYSLGRSDAVLEADTLVIRFNNDSGSNYDVQRLTAGSTTVSAAATRATASSFIGQLEAANSRPANFAQSSILILGYSNSAIEKSAIGTGTIFGNTDADTDLFIVTRSLRWRNTNVITSIVIVPANGPNFVTGSSFQLYGIL